MVTEEANTVFAVDLIEEQSCRRAVKQLRRLTTWTDAEVLSTGNDGAAIAVRQPEMRTARLFSAAPNLAIHADFEARINDVVLPFIESLWHVELSHYSEIQTVRYGPGGHYRPHADGGYFMKERYFTLLCYLNDDFSGGHTSFPSLAYSASPKAGRLLLFPSRFVHCAEPVVAGEKFVLVCWVVGPEPIDWLRPGFSLSHQLRFL